MHSGQIFLFKKAYGFPLPRPLGRPPPFPFPDPPPLPLFGFSDGSMVNPAEFR